MRSAPKTADSPFGGPGRKGGPALQISRWVVEKGSIALDGVSLTIASLGTDRFDVAVIPPTWKKTTLRERSPGDLVNAEADLLAKHVERLLAGRGTGADLFVGKPVDGRELAAALESLAGSRAGAPRSAEPSRPSSGAPPWQSPGPSAPSPRP